ncbi:hypothetical protein [Thermoflavimicrobium daqui]|uniref:Uncharacterized protein n=1 Tax=Thermoflavimicrobium daqui TaxID=2137476 RepID=A0A364K215_9BACL|nr:hypothetical protein [Thermoflavimicrobium daqui]RAL22064.1 hypothetical protein DL897_14815 [Thermoflavimicrobium daqui]
MVYHDQTEPNRSGKSRSYVAWWEKEEAFTPLPASLQQSLDQGDPEFVEQLMKYAFDFSDQPSEQKRSGDWIWALYLDSRPQAREGLLKLLTTYGKWDLESSVAPLNEKFRYSSNAYTLIPLSDKFYRYIKGIFKLADRRKDAPVWGRLAYLWDHRFDNYEQIVLQPQTKKYLQRRAWRTLRQLGEQKSADYVKMATELLLCYRSGEFSYVHYRDPKTGSYLNHPVPMRYQHLLKHILYRHSSILVYRDGKWKVKPDQLAYSLNERAEAFPELWDQQPDQLWRLIREAQSEPVIQFAIRALQQGNPNYLQNISAQIFATLLEEINYRTPAARIIFVTEELIKRLDMKQVDIDILAILLLHEHWEVRKRAFSFVTEYTDQLPKEKIAQLIPKLLSYLSKQYYWYFNEYRDLFRCWEEVLIEYASLEWIKPLQKQSQRYYYSYADEEIIKMVLDYIDHTRNPYDINDLLPYLHHQNLGIREKAQAILLRDFEYLQLDQSFLTSLILTEVKDEQNFAIQLLQDRKLWLVPMLPNLISNCWKYMTSREISDELRQFLAKDILGEILWEEIRVGVSIEDILDLLHSDLTELHELGFKLLESNQSELNRLSIDQLVQLARHRIALIRKQARDVMIRRMNEADVDHLLVLVETDFDDTRQWGFGYLKTLSDDEVTPNLIMGLLDSSRTDVQMFAMEMVQIYQKQLDLPEMMIRASESPYLEVQAFALQLAETQLQEKEQLQKMAHFFRTVLFYVGKGRRLKKAAILLLFDLGLQSEEMAEIVLSILGDVLHTNGQKDFEQVLRIMAQIQLRYPQISTKIRIH